MSAPVEIRCPAPHPTRPGWTCRAKLADVVPGSVEVRQTLETDPGCVRLKCFRCGAEYVVCPVRKAA